MTLQEAFERVVTDPRYLRNIEWGRPRPGHPEGSVRAHIADLERNLGALRPRPSPDDYWKLLLLIHTHDTFKAEALEGSPIGDPRNHATLGAKFLREFVDDPALVEMAERHDEPYALWRRVHSGRGVDHARLERLLVHDWDWDLFAAFLIVDNTTDGKSRAPLDWFLGELRARGLAPRFASAALPGAAT